MKRLVPFSLCALFLLPAGADAGLVAQYIAANDTDGNAVWEEELGADTGTDGDYNLNGSFSRNTAGVSSLPGITAAYDFTGGSASLSGTTYQNLDTDITGSTASVEIWFKPSDLTGQEVVWDFGGNVDGSSLTLDGSTLQLASKNNTTTTAGVTADLAGIGVGEFISALAVIDLDSDQLSLFVNGSQIAATTPFSGDTQDWAGGDGHGLAGRAGSNTGGSINGSDGDIFGQLDNFSNMTGEIAILRIYDNAFDQTGAENLHDSVAVPEPASAVLWLGGMAGLALSLVRRRRTGR